MFHLLPLLRGLQTQELSVGWTSARSHSGRSPAQLIFPFPWALLPDKALSGAGIRDPSALHLSRLLHRSPIIEHFWSSALKVAEGSGECFVAYGVDVPRTSLDFVSPTQLSVADTNSLMFQPLSSGFSCRLYTSMDLCWAVTLAKSTNHDHATSMFYCRMVSVWALCSNRTVYTQNLNGERDKWSWCQV